MQMLPSARVIELTRCSAPARHGRLLQANAVIEKPVTFAKLFHQARPVFPVAESQAPVELRPGAQCGIMIPVKLMPKLKCEELEQLKGEATLAGLRAGQTGRFSGLGAAELQKEMQQKIDALIQHLLAGHDGQPCPAGGRPIVKPREVDS